MKVSWAIEDVKAGRVIQKPDCGLTGSWMIGYRYPEPDASKDMDSTVYGLVALSDGMFMQIGTKDDVMNYLNEHKELIPIELTNITIEFNAEAENC